MNIAFLEGAEYEAARSGVPEETVMTIDYGERYNDEIVTQSDESLIFDMRDDLIAAIDELRSTIAAQQDTVDKGFALLSEAQTVARERLTALRERNTIIATQMTKIQAQSDLIAELRTQLAATLATIEQAVGTANGKSCYFCEGAGCPHCGVGAAYQE